MYLSRKTPECKWCDGQHFSFSCYRRPHNKIAVRRKEIVRKAKIQKKGAYAKKWLEVRKTWFDANPPDHASLYYCYICGKAMAKDETTLDHIKSRGRHPELRYELRNLAPCCYKDNRAKGSLDLDEYLKQKEQL